MTSTTASARSRSQRATGGRSTRQGPGSPGPRRSTTLRRRRRWVAGIIAPLILLLEQHHRAIPMAIYGGTTVLGGLLCFLLPETRGVELADGTEGGQPTAVVSD